MFSFLAATLAERNEIEISLIQITAFKNEYVFEMIFFIIFLFVWFRPHVFMCLD
jgi:hypothetical protein